MNDYHETRQRIYDMVNRVCSQYIGAPNIGLDREIEAKVRCTLHDMARMSESFDEDAAIQEAIDCLAVVDNGDHLIVSIQRPLEKP